jgi:hypothetical protein
MDFGEEFLTCPDFFPARLAGELWGERTVELALPGGAYQISGLSSVQEKIVGESFRGFLTLEPQAVEESARTQIRVFQAPPGDFRDFGEVREYRLAVDYLPGAVRVAGIDFMALLELPAAASSALRGALWTSQEEACLFAGACENFLRIAVAYQVFREGGAMVHSAALDDGESAWLFPGRSGAGKSTLCGLAEATGWRVLGDEIHILSEGEGELWVKPVPFAGDFGPVEGPLAPLPLAAVVALRHAESDELRPISAARALGLLLSTTPYLNCDPFRAAALEERLAGMVAGRPLCRELRFTRASDLAVLGRPRLAKAAA